MAEKRTKAAPTKPGPLDGGRKRVLVVKFVPSVERDGVTPIGQQHWVDAALEMFGRVFGGATAYPKATGIWRDVERGGALVSFSGGVTRIHLAAEFGSSSRALPPSPGDGQWFPSAAEGGGEMPGELDDVTSRRSKSARSLRGSAGKAAVAARQLRYSEVAQE